MPVLSASLNVSGRRLSEDFQLGGEVTMVLFQMNSGELSTEVCAKQRTEATCNIAPVRRINEIEPSLG